MIVASTLPVPRPVQVLTTTAGEPILAADVASALGLSYRAADEYLGRLARHGELARRGPGIFTRSRMGRPAFELTPLLHRVDAAIKRDLPFTPVVGWSTEWLAPYAHNVPLHHWTLLQAGAALLPTLADVLATARLKLVVSPPPDSVPDLLRLFDKPLLLLANGELYGAPPRVGLRVPGPERLVVDFYLAVTRQGLPYPTGDVAKVCVNLIAQRDLNLATLLAYAGRRRAADELSAYLCSLREFPDDVAQAVRLVTDRRASHAASVRSR